MFARGPLSSDPKLAFAVADRWRTPAAEVQAEFVLFRNQRFSCVRWHSRNTSRWAAGLLTCPWVSALGPGVAVEIGAAVATGAPFAVGGFDDSIAAVAGPAGVGGLGLATSSAAVAAVCF
jgi:hypothetical protein